MSTQPENPFPTNTAPAAPRIDFALVCVHCEASLSGTPLDGECPACSKPIANTLDPDAIDFETMTVSANIPCPQCGYNLRTLSIDGLCPECGQPFVRALSRRPLSSTDPAWRKRVLSGIHRLLFAMIGNAVLVIAIIISSFMGISTPALPTMLVMLGIESGLLVALITGIFGVSTPDRQATSPPPSAWPRRVTRTAIVVAGILFVWAHTITFLGMGFLPQGVQDAACIVSPLLLFMVGLAGPIALSLCLVQIARRAHAESLISNTGVWLALFVLTASVGVVVPMLLPRSLGTGGFGTALLYFAAIAGFVLYVLAIFGLFVYRRLLRRADAPASGRRKPN